MLVAVNLHDWIDELSDELDIDVELDESLVLDVARDAAHAVARPAAPLTTFLLGFAAAHHEAGPDGVERLAGKVMALAANWDQPAGAADDDGTDAEIPDDSAIDHSGDSYGD